MSGETCELEWYGGGHREESEALARCRRACQECQLEGSEVFTGHYRIPELPPCDITQQLQSTISCFNPRSLLFHTSFLTLQNKKLSYSRSLLLSFSLYLVFIYNHNTLICGFKYILIITYIKLQLHGLWNPEAQCRIHKDSPIIPILNRINPISRIDTYFLRPILILSSHLRLGLPKGLFPVGLPVKILKAFLTSSILATCSAHLYLLDVIIMTILYR